MMYMTDNVPYKKYKSFVQYIINTYIFFLFLVLGNSLKKGKGKIHCSKRSIYNGAYLDEMM